MEACDSVFLFASSILGCLVSRCHLMGRNDTSSVCYLICATMCACDSLSYGIYLFDNGNVSSSQLPFVLGWQP